MIACAKTHSHHRLVLIMDVLMGCRSLKNVSGIMLRATFAGVDVTCMYTFTSHCCLNVGRSDGMSQFENMSGIMLRATFASDDCMNKYTCVS